MIPNLLSNLFQNRSLSHKQQESQSSNQKNKKIGRIFATMQGVSWKNKENEGLSNFVSDQQEKIVVSISLGQFLP